MYKLPCYDRMASGSSSTGWQDAREFYSADHKESFVTVSSVTVLYAPLQLHPCIKDAGTNMEVNNVAI